MTIDAAYAAHSSISGQAIVGIFADSRGTNDKTDIKRDDQHKIFRLNDRCYAVAAGPSEPFIQAANFAAEEIADRDDFRAQEGLVPLGICEYTGVLLRHLRYERNERGISKTNFVLTAGFTRDGTPAVASVELVSWDTEMRFLYVPMAGEVVARVIGDRNAEPILAEALRMDIAKGLRFDASLSVLNDMTQDPERPFIGGNIHMACCNAIGIFERKIYSTDGNAKDFEYSTMVYEYLQALDKAERLFTGGQPRISWLRFPQQQHMGHVGLFDNDEPPGLTTGQPLDSVIAVGSLAIPMTNNPESGLHHEEKRSIESHRPQKAIETLKKKKRR